MHSGLVHWVWSFWLFVVLVLSLSHAFTYRRAWPWLILGAYFDNLIVEVQPLPFSRVSLFTVLHYRCRSATIASG